uniref:Uncharacterized protein n=1 Tax=Steinernema glaseri TaxID=37863 RepID=A0A1I8ARV1_9BILA
MTLFSAPDLPDGKNGIRKRRLATSESRDRFRKSIPRNFSRTREKQMSYVRADVAVRRWRPQNGRRGAFDVEAVLSMADGDWHWQSGIRSTQSGNERRAAMESDYSRRTAIDGGAASITTPVIVDSHGEQSDSVCAAGAGTERTKWFFNAHSTVVGRIKTALRR